VPEEEERSLRKEEEVPLRVRVPSMVQVLPAVKVRVEEEEEVLVRW
jgi:hypothetical protein